LIDFQTSAIMEDYLASLQKTLLDLLGEDLALKVTSDVADCLTLDLLQNISQATTESSVLEHMQNQQQQHNQDARVALTGMVRLESLLLSVEGRFSADFPTSLEFMEAGGVETILSCMTNNPNAVVIQKKGSAILLKTVNYAVSPNINDFLETPRAVNALVNAIARHTESIEVQEAVICTLSVMEKAQAKYLRHLTDENGGRLYPFQTFVASAGGIPLLFAAVQRYPTNYSIGACALNVLQSLRLDNDSTRLELVRYARAHPEWRAIVARCNATAGLEAYLLRHTLSGT